MAASMTARSSFSLFCLLFFVSSEVVFSLPTDYNVGVGIADITGPAAEVDMVSVTLFTDFKLT